VTGPVGRATRSIATGLAASIALSSCAHLDEGDDPSIMIERAIREVCVPFVVDGIDHDEGGRRLGGWWFRTPPDPFTPMMGGLFRQGPATIQLSDGVSARTYDGALTTRPMRSCTVWTGRRLDEAALVGTVRAAAASRPDATLVDPVNIDGGRRVVACIPSGLGRIAVVGALVFSSGEAGANVHEASVGPRTASADQTTSGANTATTCS
jgi:hypothetical protein